MHDRIQNARILIVDDTLQNIQVLGTLLKKEQYQINVARDGVQALQAVERVSPDLILLDVMMPEMDGFETCRRLKAMADTRDIPIIFLTAKVETDDIVTGFELGAVDYVTKPFNSTELLVRVRTHLTIRSLQQEQKKQVVELAEELDRSEKLQKKIASLTREQEAFLRHELKNRITPIMGYAELLSLEIDNEQDQQAQWAKNIVIATRAMSSLVDLLKILQDIEAGNVTLVKKACDVDQLIRRVTEDLMTVYGNQVNIVYKNHITDNTIGADSNLLTGVFQNLIKNAVEHVLDLDNPAERQVRVDIFHENGHIVVKIRNGGEPVPPERVATFFEKFNTDRTRKKDGTGLGTTYAYLVTRAHGGEITVDSNETNGTILTVKLNKETPHG